MVAEWRLLDCLRLIVGGSGIRGQMTVMLLDGLRGPPLAVSVDKLRVHLDPVNKNVILMS